MKKIKHALAYLLVLAMACGVAACGASAPLEVETTTEGEPTEAAKNYTINESDGIAVYGVGVLASSNGIDLTEQGLVMPSGVICENGPITATRPDGTTTETDVEYRLLNGTIVPYMEATVVDAEDWTLEHLVELYQNNETWLRPEGFYAAFVFSSDGEHYASIADETDVIDDYRVGWVMMDREYVWNVADIPVIDDLSEANLVQKYQNGTWDGSMVWSPTLMKSAWVGGSGSLVYCSPRDGWWSKWTYIYPAAGVTPVSHATSVGNYTLAIRGGYVEAYRKDGAPLGAYNAPKGEHDYDVYDFLWTEEIYAEHPEYKPLVYLNGDFYQVSLDGAGVTRAYRDWLTLKVTDEDIEILYLDGNDLRLFSLEEGDTLIAENCSLAEARRYVPVLDQTKRISKHGEQIASSWFDTSLMIPLETLENGSQTADVMTIPSQMLASQYY